MKSVTYTVWALDVWGHGPDEHEEYDCKGGDHCGGYEVNDRCKVGTCAVDFTPQRFNVGTPHEFEAKEPCDGEILAALDRHNFIHAELCEVDDNSGEGTWYIQSKVDGLPLLQLEVET